MSFTRKWIWFCCVTNEENVQNCRTIAKRQMSRVFPDFILILFYSEWRGQIYAKRTKTIVLRSKNECNCSKNRTKSTVESIKSCETSFYNFFFSIFNTNRVINKVNPIYLEILKEIEDIERYFEMPKNNNVRVLNVWSDVSRTWRIFCPKLSHSLSFKNIQM